MKHNFRNGILAYRVFLNFLKMATLKGEDHVMEYAQIAAGMIFVLLLAAHGTGQPENASLQSIPTVSELRQTPGEANQVVYVRAYHEPGDRGEGHFIWRPKSRAEADGGTVFAVGDRSRGRWHRLADDVKVTYFGARGDGEHDDTTVIQAAIDSVSSTEPPGVMFEADREVGGTVVIPAGKYRITDTLLLGPHTTLKGVGSAPGFQRRSVLKNDRGTVLMGEFPDPKKWMVSTAVYFREGDRKGELLGYRQHTSGGPYDQGKISRANGVRVQDMLLIGRENKAGDVPYGGVRFQACPGAVIEGVGVFNVDVAWMLNAGWGLTMRDCHSQSHLYGLLAIYGVNGLHVDSCYINAYRNSKRTINDSNFTPPTHHGPEKMKKWHMPRDYFYKTRGIYSIHGHGRRAPARWNGLIDGPRRLTDAYGKPRNRDRSDIGRRADRGRPCTSGRRIRCGQFGSLRRSGYNCGTTTTRTRKRWMGQQ